MPTRKTTSKKPAASAIPPHEPLWLEPTTPEVWRFDFGKFAFGLFLVILGLLYLAKNSGWLPLDFDFSLLQLWPMLLIFFGLSFVSGRGWSGLLTGSLFTLIVLVIAGIFISNRIKLQLDPELTNPRLAGHLPTTATTRPQPISIDKLSTTNLANIQINQDLGVLNLSSGDTNQLVLGELSSNYAKLLVNAQSSASSQSLTLSTISNKSRSSQADNQLTLALANNTPFNLAINSGSSRLNLDLNELIVKDLQINSLGSDLYLSANHTNGNKRIQVNGPLTNLNLDLSNTGNIRLSAPGISALDLEDFEVVDDNSIKLTNKSSSSTLDIELDTLPDKLLVAWQ
jgi:hypothetical protein